MEKFKNTNLILEKDGKIFQINLFSELVENIFGKDYENLTKSEKMRVRYNLAYPMAILSGTQVAISNKGIVVEGYKFKSQEVDIENSILIDDDFTFLLGLAKINKIKILEEKEANIFGKYLMDKNFEGNYINIGNLTKEIIKNYLEQRNKANEKQ